jgi:hypothetical protein
VALEAATPSNSEVLIYGDGLDVPENECRKLGATVLQTDAIEETHVDKNSKEYCSIRLLK